MNLKKRSHCWRIGKHSDRIHKSLFQQLPVKITDPSNTQRKVFKKKRKMELFGHTKRKYEELIPMSVNYLQQHLFRWKSKSYGESATIKENHTHEDLHGFVEKLSRARTLSRSLGGLRRNDLAPGTLNHTGTSNVSSTSIASINLILLVAVFHLNSRHLLNNHTVLRWAFCFAF